jgi:hypothetical protein
MNLVNMAMKYIGPAVAERIASKMGIGGPVVNKLIAAALPAILGSVIGKSQSGGGLGAIMDLVTGSNRPSTNGLADMFDGGGDIDGLAQSGTSMLGGLLGGQGLSALTGALGRHGGVDENQAGSLLGMLAPAALGSIGDQVQEQGMDASGLASFLSAQAPNVAQAMPAELASDLDGTDLFAGFKSSLTSGAGAATAAATSAATAAQATAKSGGSKLPLIIGIAVAALAAWYFFGRGGAPEVDLSNVAGQEIMVGDVDVASEFGNLTGSLKDTFAGITDADSAQAAVPQLQELAGKFTGLSESTEGLSGAAKTGFQGIVSTALESIRPMIEGAIESSGAGAILQPIADQIIAALEGMAG